jgi:hypothetical protein
MVCASYLDSVQNFDLGAGWDWTNFGAPFDSDSTFGLYANARIIGALDVPELANLTLDILEITERNGNAVPGWFMTHYYDCDNGSDTMQINNDHSVAWTLNGGATQAIGNIKIPFGCGYDPIINIVGTYGVSGSHGFWDWNEYWNAQWGYCNLGQGAFTDGTGTIHGGDEEAHVTIAQHDFAPNETYEIGIAHFLLTGLTDALDPNNADILALADLANKWAGWNRGDVNNDGVVGNLVDIIWLANTVANGTPGAIPFDHLSDVDGVAGIDINDVDYLIDYYFNCGPCPVGGWTF